MTQTVVWLGKGVYARGNGVWYHEVTCPDRTAGDYERRYFAEVPVPTMRAINGMDDLARTITGLRLSFASSYVNLTRREAMVLATVCRRWRIPYDLQTETTKARWRKPVTRYFFAAPLNELCK